MSDKDKPGRRYDAELLAASVVAERSDNGQMSAAELAQGLGVKLTYDGRGKLTQGSYAALVVASQGVAKNPGIQNLPASERGKLFVNVLKFLQG